MKIVVFSLGVVFQNVVQGGSQKVLRDLSIGLAKKGHQIIILCPYRYDNQSTFHICENVIVKPILPLRGAFPLPYEVSPFALTEVCHIVEEEIQNADLLYCHDGGLNIEFLKNRIPTVISLRDFCYNETLLGALNFQEEFVIVNSLHTFQCLHDSFQQVNPNLKNRIVLIYNGYSGEIFRHSHISKDFYDTTGLPMKENEFVIGYPHRPDNTKGFENALQVLYRLKQQCNNPFKLLIPQYMDKGISDRTDKTYYSIQRIIEELDLSENILTYEWIPHNKMPEFYSYCDLVLCIGSFVESFSNVAMESLLCETPVIAAFTSTYRTMPVKEYLHLVPYGDIEKTAYEVSHIMMQNNDCKQEEARKFIIKHFAIDKMVDEYEEVFNKALQRNDSRTSDESVAESHYDLSTVSHVKLAAWCDFIDGKIFDDYSHIYYEDIFKGVIKDNSTIFSIETLNQEGVSSQIIEYALRKGILVTIKR